jgi:hypothetical protein
MRVCICVICACVLVCVCVRLDRRVRVCAYLFMRVCICVGSYQYMCAHVKRSTYRYIYPGLVKSRAVYAVYIICSCYARCVSAHAHTCIQVTMRKRTCGHTRTHAHRHTDTQAGAPSSPLFILVRTSAPMKSPRLPSAEVQGQRRPCSP